MDFIPAVPYALLKGPPYINLYHWSIPPTTTMTSRWSTRLFFLLAITPSSNGTLSLPTSPANNSTHSLASRQSTWNAATNDCSCDDKLPTLAEIVARIQDTSDGGLADPYHVAVFWTNLNDPNLRTSDAQRAAASCMAGFLKSRGLKYYWWFEHMNVHCKLSDTLSN